MDNAECAGGVTELRCIELGEVLDKDCWRTGRAEQRAAGESRDRIAAADSCCSGRTEAAEAASPGTELMLPSTEFESLAALSSEGTGCGTGIAASPDLSDRQQEPQDLGTEGFSAQWLSAQLRRPRPSPVPSLDIVAACAAGANVEVCISPAAPKASKLETLDTPLLICDSRPCRLCDGSGDCVVPLTCPEGDGQKLNCAPVKRSNVLAAFDSAVWEDVLGDFDSAVWEGFVLSLVPATQSGTPTARSSDDMRGCRSRTCVRNASTCPTHCLSIEITAFASAPNTLPTVKLSGCA